MVRAEARKLLTLPSLRWAMLLTWPVCVLLTRTPADPAFYAQAGFLVFGVLAAASEHQAGGQIRTTLLAMPRRLSLQVAKAAALTAVAAPAAVVAALLAGDLAATTYLTLTALLGAAVATMLRNAVAAVVVLLSAQFIAGPLLRGVADHLPARDRPAVTIIWTVAAAVAAAAFFDRRDA
ncbi:hypothetical protein AB0M20_38560 [Actinoplanes sp. NPDC051633]|uniref:hypothetical protein n=1 Tax=Actinoplanes sp. NPDC051633 TaxID=3155670 RepID=UPI003425AAA1